MRILDGNKSILALLAARLIGLDIMVDFLGPGWYEIIANVIDALTVGAITHHGLKGEFKATPKK